MPLLDDISKGVKKGVEEAGKGIKKGVEEAGKGLKEVGEKASDAVKTFEIQQEIDKLEAEIKSIKVELGDAVLVLMAKGTTLDPTLTELAVKVEGIKAQIEGKKAKIEEIKND
ncbi:MAG: hypothetical protein GYA52_07050 [Chloroflexi bacterium]|nr:hypothetical protein [Chloroflexota bacterium]